MGIQRTSHRYALAACVGLLLASGMFFVGASTALAAQTCLTDTQGKKICTATTPVSDTSVRTKPSPGADPNCKYYDGGNLTDCKNADGTIESCIYTPLPTGDLVTDCATRDATGTITKINNSTIGAASADINTGIDPTTGQIKTTVDSPTLNAVGSAIGTVFECVASGPVDCVITATGSAILKISQLFLGVAGVLFNYTVVYTVFRFSTVVGNAPGLLVAWGIMRDLGNMLLLFGFIFMGLATILDLHNYTAKKALPRLIIFAILMNFSLFAAEAVIDTANMFSSVLYEQAHSEQCASLNGTGPTAAQGSTNYNDAVKDLTTDCRLNYGIGGSIMSASGLSTMFAVQDNQALQSIAVYIGLSLFATIGAIVMIAASIMLITRTVVLTFVMMLSPIGFAGMAVPALNGVARKWWSELLHQAFFAPILLLLILASLKVSESFAGVTGNGSLAQAFMQPNASVMGIILVFFLVIGLLVGSLVAAKNFGARGANFAIGKTTAFIGGGTFGVGAWAGRNSIGRAFNKADEGIRKSAFGQTRFGRRVATITEKGAKASYDVRATAPIKALGKGLGGDFGKPGKDGYAGQVKRETEEYTKYAGTLKQTAEAKEREEQLKEKKKLVEENKKAEDQRWETEKAEKEAEITRFKAEITAREKGRAEQSGRLNAAIASGDQAAYAREKNSMDELMANHQKLDAETDVKIQKSQTELQTKKTEHDKFAQGFYDELKDIDTEMKGDLDKGIAGVDSNSSKRGYAINIKRSSVPPWKGKSREKAFEAIKADLKKTKSEKLIEGLKKSIDEGKHDTKHELEAVKGAIDEETKAVKDAGGDHGHDHSH